MVFPPVADALPNAMIGLRLVVFTAWLHYLFGVSVDNILRILSVVCRFKISTGGLIRGKNLVETALSLAKTIIGKATVPERELNLAA